MLLPLMFNILFGGLIGGCTNEYAIRYVLRRVIPARKKELAAAIQKIFTDELMTPGSIVSWLDNSKGTLDKYVGVWLDTVTEMDLPSLKDLMSKRFGQEGIFRMDQWRHTAVNEAIKSYEALVRQEIFSKEILFPILKHAWEKQKSNSLSSFLPEISDRIVDTLSQHIGNVLTQPEFQNQINHAISAWIIDYLDKKTYVSEIIPGSALKMMREMVCSQHKYVTEQIVCLLENREIQEMLYNVIMKAIQDECTANPLLGIVSSFVNIHGNVRSLCSRLPEKVEQTLKSHEGQAKIEQVLGNTFDSFANREWRSFFEGPIKVQELIENIMINLPDMKATLFNTSNITEFCKKELTTLMRKPLENLPFVTGNEDSILLAISDSFTGIIQNKHCLNLLRNKLLEHSENLVAKPIGRLNNWCSKDFRKKMAHKLSEYLLLIVREKLADFTEATGIWNIVSRSIINFDVKKLESMVRLVCNQELRWVTALGFILGACVGVVQGMINLFF